MRLIDADAMKSIIERRRKAAKTLTGIDMVMLLDDAPTIGGWIRVKDRLPDTAGEYIVAYHPCHWNNVDWDKVHVGIDSFRGKTTWAKHKYQRVTHWMPLPSAPEPPKEATDEGACSM